MKTFKTPNDTVLPLLNLKGKDYLQIAHRIVWFREVYPAWGIETEMLESSPTHAIFKATIKDETGRIIAQATKVQTEKDFKVFHEKAETGAIGRALALIGFGTQFCADELDEGDQLADAPTVAAQYASVRNGKYKEDDIPDFNIPPPISERVDSVPLENLKATVTKQISEPQIKRLYAIAKSNGWTYDSLHNHMKVLGIKSVKELSFNTYDPLVKYVESHPQGTK